MKKAEVLFRKLGIRFYTSHILNIVNDFIKSNGTDAKELLSKITSDYDEQDVFITNEWIKEEGCGRKL